MSSFKQRAPWHLWLVGVLAILWNGWGSLNYVAAQLQWEMVTSRATPEALDYISNSPAWVDACWAIGVWGGLLGSLLLLLRSHFAVILFALSLLGLLGTTIYQRLLSTLPEMMLRPEQTVFAVVIWIVALLLFWYALKMKRAGVLG